jgi:hypothetical protein
MAIPNFQFASWITRNPLTAGAAGVAALAAPLFLKNDDRGYFKTASITTPLIGAGAIAGQQVFRTRLLRCN